MNDPKPLTTTQKIMAETCDEMLTSWLTNGVEEWTGQLDAQNNPIMVRKVLSAAQMRCVLTRLSQLGATSTAAPGSAAGNLIEAARARGIGSGGQGGPIPFRPPAPPTRPLPPLSEADDAATA